MRGYYFSFNPWTDRKCWWFGHDWSTTYWNSEPKVFTRCERHWRENMQVVQPKAKHVQGRKLRTKEV